MLPPDLRQVWLFIFTEKRVWFILTKYWPEDTENPSQLTLTQRNCLQAILMQLQNRL